MTCRRLLCAPRSATKAGATWYTPLGPWRYIRQYTDKASISLHWLLIEGSRTWVTPPLKISNMRCWHVGRLISICVVYIRDFRGFVFIFIRTVIGYLRRCFRTNYLRHTETTGSTTTATCGHMFQHFQILNEAHQYTRAYVLACKLFGEARRQRRLKFRPFDVCIGFPIHSCRQLRGTLLISGRDSCGQPIAPRSRKAFPRSARSRLPGRTARDACP